MPTLTTLLSTLPAGILLMLGGLPSQTANRHTRRLRSVVVSVAAIQFLCAVAALLLRLPALLQGVSPLTADLAGVGIYLDGFSAVMLSMVAFVGLVVTRFSVRYLDGDPNQGRFFRWMGFTIGSVSLFVISGHLVLLAVAWMLASFGLHQLLVHYGDRRGAQTAAWTKFAVSRLGDGFLVLAIALIYRVSGTLQLSELFTSDLGTSWGLTAACWLFIFAAAVKSAQFPLHAWLPKTLEAPTPVSALMHAGIVNAGGYLVIRLNPILVQTPSALGFLAIAGSVTVGYAGLVMLTQSSIKRSLVYSTIAQMGFMMLQCGIGAFSAAMLHIIAHSLYKAHAFLNSGSVLSEADGRREPAANSLRPLHAGDFVGGFILAGFVVWVSAAAFGIHWANKPGGLVLSFILTLALTGWAWDVFRLNSVRATATGLATMASVGILYMLGYFAVDHLVAAGAAELPPGRLQIIAATDIAVMFLALFAIQRLLGSDKGRELLKPLYIHAVNGFYIEAITQRLLPSRR